MSSALQNRLVGTIIIVALAVIFLPDVLDGKKDTTQAVFVDLPPQPRIQQVEEPPKFPLEEVKQSASLKTEVVADVATDDFDIQGLDGVAPQNADPRNSTQSETDSAAPVVIPSPEKVNQSSSEISVGWVVQLGVFRHQKNVQELLGRLRQQGYKAFSRPVNTSSGQLTKVFVGPELDKQSLQSALPDLEKLTKLKGRVSPFSIK